MVNPHWCYVISFLGALVVYQFGWSKLYPTLTSVTLFFISVTIITHLFLGWIWKKKELSYPSATQHVSPGIITCFLYLLWTIEFIYEGGIPLVKIILQQPFNYRLFGVPSLHVFNVTFTSFYAVFLFHLYLTSKRKINLILFLVNLSAALLIYNRGMFIFILTASLFVFLTTVQIRLFRFSFMGVVLAIALLYIFGMLGNIRESAESKTNYNADIFMELGQPTERFSNSFVPKEFFWSYIYISSPIANLQTNINAPRDNTSNYFWQLINNEMIFDFISKRINSRLGWERIKDHTIPGPFNVSTVYSKSFSYLGWWGLIFIALCGSISLDIWLVASAKRVFINGNGNPCNYVFVFSI